MKGLIYREFYLSRKPVVYMLLAYFIFVVMITMIIISTYAGNLAKSNDSADTRDYLLSQMYLYAGLIGMAGCTYGHNDLIEKDYKSRWQLYSYTLPVPEKKIMQSKLILRTILLALGFVLAVIAEVIFSAAGKVSVSTEHIKNILVILFVYGSMCIIDIPYMIIMKTQNRGVAFVMIFFVPLTAAIIYGAYKFEKFCSAEAARLYPNMESDAGMMKVAMPYLTKWRDIFLWAGPFILIGIVIIAYFWGIKELKRRRY